MILVRMSLLILLLALPMGAWAASGPKIKLDNESHDYGAVQYGANPTAQFELTNVGDETLVIQKVRASCGCTKAVHGTTEVPPGGKTVISATYETEGERPGRKKKSLHIHTNDPEKPVITVTLTADLVREVLVDPPALTKKLSEFQERISFPAKISNSSSRPVTLNKAELTGAKGTVHLQPAIVVVQPGDRAPFEIIMELTREDRWPYQMGHVILHTDNPVEKKVDLRYFVQVGDIKPKEEDQTKN
ncbi:MAG: DUF1573 domain-containing protein [Deltaproteobacteria bacterium]|nr:DUF1573 domain-containing protein [Deltaproteobacteria bacterium]